MAEAGVGEVEGSGGVLKARLLGVPMGWMLGVRKVPRARTGLLA